MMQLDSVLAKETMEEVERRNLEPTLVEVDERHHFRRLRTRCHLTIRGPPSDNFLL